MDLLSALPPLQIWPVEMAFSEYLGTAIIFGILSLFTYWIALTLYRLYFHPVSPSQSCPQGAYLTVFSSPIFQVRNLLLLLGGTNSTMT